MMLDTAVMFDRVVRANAADAEQADRIVQNRFFRNMAGALSGTQEYMASEALHQLHGDERFDVVVVDTPPSRHALDFLEAPGVLARFLEHKVFKLLMLPTRSGLRVLNTAAQPILRAIGRVVGSDVLADAVAFFQAFAGMEVGFRERAASVMSLLISPQTRYVLVAAPRHDTVAEAVWFAEQLRRAWDRGRGGGRQPGASAVRIGIGGRGRPSGRPRRKIRTVAALWANLAELRTIAEREREAVAPLDERLDGAPLVEVPLLAGDVHDLDGLVEIGRHLFKRWPVPVAGNVGACTSCSPPTPTGSSTRSRPRSAGPTRASRCAGRAASSSASWPSASPTWRSSTCRSDRRAGWPSRWRCGSTSRPACSRTSR